MDNSSLVFFSGSSSKLIPVSDHELIFEDRPHILLSFEIKNDDNKSIVWTDGAMRQHAKSYTKINMDVDNKAKLCASYRSDELSVVITIAMMENNLILSILGQQLPLNAITENQFTAMGMFTINCERDSNGEITGLRLDAPRAENILFDKI